MSDEFFLLTPNERMKFQKEHRPFDFLAQFVSSGEELANAVLRHKGIVLDSIIEDENLQKFFALNNPSGKTYLDLLEERIELLTFLLEAPNSNLVPKIFLTKSQKI